MNRKAAFHTIEGLGLGIAPPVAPANGRLSDTTLDDLAAGHAKLEFGRQHSHLLASASSQPSSRWASRHAAAAHCGGLRGGASSAVVDGQHTDDGSSRTTSGGLQLMNFFKYMFAGAMSAVVSRTVVAPFERVKLDILLQNSPGTSLETATRIMRMEGIMGFWKGHGLNVMRTAPYKAVNFTSYELFSLALQNLSEAWASPSEAEQMKNVTRFTAGALAGVSATVICFPLDVLRVRMMAPGGSPYGGLVATARGILQKEGIAHFYTGLFPAVISMAPAGAVFYGVYDILKDVALEREAKARGLNSSEGLQLDPVITLLFGGLSGAAAEGSVYPLEVVRRRMQVLTIRPGTNLSVPKHPLGLMQASAMSVLERDGLRGFYSGVFPSIIQVLPNAAISYLAYETFKGMFDSNSPNSSNRNAASLPKDTRNDSHGAVATQPIPVGQDVATTIRP